MLFSLPGIHQPTHSPSLSLSSSCVKTFLLPLHMSRVYLPPLGPPLPRTPFLFIQIMVVIAHLSLSPAVVLSSLMTRILCYLISYHQGLVLSLLLHLFSLTLSAHTHAECSGSQRSKARGMGYAKDKETDTSWHKRHNSIHWWNFIWPTADGRT